jgi:hypothetical protein
VLMLVAPPATHGRAAEEAEARCGIEVGVCAQPGVLTAHLSPLNTGVHWRNT